MEKIELTWEQIVRNFWFKMQDDNCLRWEVGMMNSTGVYVNCIEHQGTSMERLGMSSELNPVKGSDFLTFSQFCVPNFRDENTMNILRKQAGENPTSNLFLDIVSSKSLNHR
jgi:hypothetical protein